MLCTLAQPTGGPARVAGYDVVRGRPMVRRNIGLVFQDPTLDTYLSAKSLVILNPVTYAVHPVRTAVFAHVDAPARALARLNPPITWFGWEVATLAVAIMAFNRAE